MVDKYLLVQIHSSDLFLIVFYLLCYFIYLFFYLKKKKEKALWSVFMNGIQLPEGYRATTRRHFTFYH